MLLSGVTDPGTQESGFTLLLVDDEVGVLNALRRVFADENYRILTASSAADALAILEKEAVHLIVTDHRMPGMSGAEFLREAKLKWPEIIRIMLTGFADVQSIMGAVKDGAVFKFITKPWNDEDLRLTVSLGLQQYILLQENRKLKELARKRELKGKAGAFLFGENREMLGSILVKAGILRQEELEQSLQREKTRRAHQRNPHPPRVCIGCSHRRHPAETAEYRNCRSEGACYPAKHGPLPAMGSLRKKPHAPDQARWPSADTCHGRPFRH